MSDTLSKDYVLELIKCALTNTKALDICSRHLKYEYLQNEIQKKAVKYIFDTYELTSKAPTIGTIGQAFSGNADMMSFLSKLKKIDVAKKEDIIINSFETFIKDIRFQSIIKKVVELYNADKSDDAVKVLAKESENIANFSLKDKYYTKVFEQFDDRMDKRIRAMLNTDAYEKERLVTGVGELTALCGGGFRKGTSFLCMARSGVGKTTYLRWVAIANARLGKRVVVFQGEDTEDNAMEAFDAAWTSITINDIEHGEIPDEKIKGIIQAKKEIKARGGEIILVAAEQFDLMSIEECREKLQEIIKTEGPVDMVLFDYLEIFTTKGHNGKGEAAERRRREDIANKITNIATEFKVVTGTATQSADISIENINNPDFKLTRHHASEFKNIIKPFSYFFTFNATEEEYKQQILRIYVDKLRRHQSGQTVKIYQSRDNGRFYDSYRTKVNFYNAA